MPPVTAARSRTAFTIRAGTRDGSSVFDRGETFRRRLNEAGTFGRHRDP